MNQGRARARIDWIGILVIVAMVSVLFVAGAFSESTSNIDKILNVQVQTEDGVKIAASLPFSVIESIVDSTPKELEKVIEKHRVHIKEILAELKKMEGKDLIQIKGANNVRIGVGSWKSEEDDYIKVNVQPGGEDNDVDEINICLPKGLVTIALAAAKDMNFGEGGNEIGKVIEEVMKGINEGMKHEGDSGRAQE